MAESGWLDASELNSNLSSTDCVLVHNHHSCRLLIYHTISNGTSLLQQLWQLALLCLKLGVSTNVLLVDENIWDAALGGHALEGVLNRGTVIDLVELDEVGLCAHLAQKRLGRLAVWAVRLGEDGNGVVVDDALRLSLGCHDCIWARGTC